MAVFSLDEVVAHRRMQIQHDKVQTERATVPMADRPKCKAWKCTQLQTRAFKDSPFCDEHEKAIRFQYAPIPPTNRFQAWWKQRRKNK